MREQLMRTKLDESFVVFCSEDPAVVTWWSTGVRAQHVDVRLKPHFGPVSWGLFEMQR